MLWFKQFMSRYGTMFIGVYLLSFFGLVSVQTSTGILEGTYGDVSFTLGTFDVYLPFISALGLSFFLVTVWYIYRFLKK